MPHAPKDLPLLVRWAGRQPTELRGSAHWEVVEIPGLYVYRPAGERCWKVNAIVQQRSLAYRLWSLLADQQFPTRRAALQAVAVVRELHQASHGH